MPEIPRILFSTKAVTPSSISFGVAYGSSTRAVSEAVRQVLEKHGRILKKPEPLVLFEDFGDSALIFTVHFWVSIDPEVSYRVIESDFRHMLSKRFAEAGIVIAFPQQDVHLDAGKPIPVNLVEAFANDIKAYLHAELVQARPSSVLLG